MPPVSRSEQPTAVSEIRRPAWVQTAKPRTASLRAGALSRPRQTPNGSDGSAEIAGRHSIGRHRPFILGGGRGQKSLEDEVASDLRPRHQGLVVSLSTGIQGSEPVSLTTQPCIDVSVRRLWKGEDGFGGLGMFRAPKRDDGLPQSGVGVEFGGFVETGTDI